MKKYIIPLLSMAVLLLSSCVSNEIPGEDDVLPGGRSPLVINAGLPGSGKTRAVINEPDTADGWSYKDFQPGDEMGFFASSGKFTGENYGEAPFINQKLEYIGGTGEDNFRDPSGTEFSPSHINGDKIFMYYPYSDAIDSEYGMEIRTMKFPGPNGARLDTARCIDFLSTRHLEVYGTVNNETAALYGEFQHTFAELIIMRGEGFDNPPQIPGKNEWEIKAVLNKPVTHIKAAVDDTDGWSCAPELTYDPSIMESSKATEWDAWLGANFYRTQEDKVGQTAWYVIVPTIGCQAKYVAPRPGERTRVEYIELYDNDGNLQRVSSLLLSNGNSKYVDGGWRYPMEISMKELVPTANPCQIVPWDGDVDLTDERKRGINNESDFYNWVNAYNAYITDKNEDTSKALLQYGDLYVNADESEFWHFYVLKDLDLSGYKGLVVKELRDIIDGQSTVLSNGQFQSYSITGLQTTFIEKMSGPNAVVQNFRFVSPDVNYGTDNSSAAGIIANVMEGGASVINCQIRRGSLYNPGGPGGMVAGSISDGTVKDCYLSGFLISQSTYDVIVGQVEGTYTNENNDANNVTNQNRE